MQPQGILSQFEALIGKPRDVPPIHPRGVTGLCRALLEVEAEFGRVRPRRHKMRSAERGKKIVERRLVGQVDGRESQAPFVVIATEQVVVAHAQIKQVPRRDARRVVIVVCRSRSRKADARRTI